MTEHDVHVLFNKALDLVVGEAASYRKTVLDLLAAMGAEESRLAEKRRKTAAVERQILRAVNRLRQNPCDRVAMATLLVKVLWIASRPRVLETGLQRELRLWLEMGKVHSAARKKGEKTERLVAHALQELCGNGWRLDPTAAANRLDDAAKTAEGRNGLPSRQRLQQIAHKLARIETPARVRKEKVA